jgi:hypothetical protein
VLNNYLLTALRSPVPSVQPHPYVCRLRDVLSTIRNYYRSDDNLLVDPIIDDTGPPHGLTFEEIMLPRLSVMVFQNGSPREEPVTLDYVPESPLNIGLYLSRGDRKTKFASEIVWSGSHWRPDAFSLSLDEQSHAEFVHAALIQAGLISIPHRRLKAVN